MTTLEISPEMYSDFFRWRLENKDSPDVKYLRIGQHFFNWLGFANSNELDDESREWLDRLYEMDGTRAISMIHNRVNYSL